MTPEQKIIAGMAHTRIDAAKRALTAGETMLAKFHLNSAISKIEMVEKISPAAPAPDQKRSTAFLDIEATNEPL